MKKTVTLFTLLLTGVIFLTGCQTSAQQTNKNILRVGTEGTYAPFSYRNEQNQLVGYDVEVASAIAKKIGYDIEFVEGPWDSLIAAFDAKKTDTVFNQVSITEERKAKYDFSLPYMVSHASLITHQDNTVITDFTDIKGKISAQSLTSNYAKKAEELGATLASVDSFSNAVELLQSNRADVTLNTDVAFYDYLKQKPNAPIKIVKTLDESLFAGAIFHKGNPEFITKVNKAVTELQADGTLTQLSQKYFNKDISK